MPRRDRPPRSGEDRPRRELGCGHEENPDLAQPCRTSRLRRQEDQVLSPVVPLKGERLVLFCTDVAWDRFADPFRAAAPALEVITLTGDDAVADDELARITVAFFSGDAWPGRAAPFMSSCLRAPSLRWMHTASAGVDSPIFARFTSRGIRLTTSSGASALPIAHTAIMMMLGLSRDIPGRLRDQSEHRWQRRMSDDVDGANVAIVGMGPIGTETAKLALALGMNPIGCRRTVAGDEPCETRTFAALDELLRWADYVVLALPLTPDTHRLIGAEQLARMKPTARLINVGRGDLVDEAALVDALANGRLAGAALDVFAVEPLPAESPLWDMPNVIVSAHDSGATNGSNHRAAMIFADNLGRYSRGEPLRNEVGTAPATR